MGHNGSGPPDKFPQWVDLSPFTTPADRAIQLGIAYKLFYDTYHVWPTVAIPVDSVVYLGAYEQD